MAHFVPLRPPAQVQQSSPPYQIPPIVFNPVHYSDKFFSDFPSAPALPTSPHLAGSSIPYNVTGTTTAINGPTHGSAGPNDPNIPTGPNATSGSISDSLSGRDNGLISTVNSAHNSSIASAENSVSSTNPLQHPIFHSSNSHGYQNGYYPAYLNGPSPAPSTPSASMYYYQHTNPWLPSQYYSSEDARFLRPPSYMNRGFSSMSSITAVPPAPSPFLMSPPLFSTPPRDSRIPFKPRHTKRNLRPKINKIARESSPQTKKAKFVLGEYSLDALYEAFQNALRINTSRMNIAEAYQYAFEDEIECKLFDLFVHKLSHSIDVFLPQDRFQKIVAELALYEDTRMILNAIFCLSSLMLLRLNPAEIDLSYPLKYYQKTVALIRYFLSHPNVDNETSGILARCLISTNLLCIYELFFVAIDSTYVKGAGSILMSILSKKNGSGSLLRDNPFYNTCFIAMVVCDLVLSLKFELPCTFSIEKTWKSLDPDFFQQFLSPVSHQLELAKPKKDINSYLSSSIFNFQSTHWWQYKVIVIFSIINDFSNCYDVITKEDFEENTQYHRWVEINKMLQDIESSLPLPLKPTIYHPCSPTRLFPLVLFKDESTAIADVNFKLAKILHYSTLVEKIKVQNTGLIDSEKSSYSPDYRQKLSKDVVGILKTYDSNFKIWPVAIHALRQAGKHIEKNLLAAEELTNFTQRVVNECHTQLDFVYKKKPSGE